MRRLFRQRRLTSYLLRELRTPTLLAVVLFSFVLLMNHFFLVAGQAISKSLSAELTLKLFLVGVPQLLVLVIPMSVLLGSLVALGRLSSDHEWVALQSAGCGLGAVYRPALIQGSVAALICFGIYGWLVPSAAQLERGLRLSLLRSANLAADLKPRAFYNLNMRSTLFVEDIVAGVPDHRLRGVFLARPGTGDSAAELVIAASGDMYPDPDSDGSLLVDLYQGEIRQYADDGAASYKVSDFIRAERYRIATGAEVQQSFGGTEYRAPGTQYLPVLWSEVIRARQALDEARVRAEQDSSFNAAVQLAGWRVANTELHQRFALPFACVAFSLLAVPLGLRFARSGKGAGFALSLAFILLYRVVWLLSRNQGAFGAIPPWLGVWTANALILAIAVIALWRFRRADRPGWLSGIRGALASRRLRRLERQAASRSALDPDASPVTVAGEVAADLASLGGTSTRFIRLLDLYVMRCYGRVLVLAIAAAYVIFALVMLQRLVEDLLKTKQPLALIPEYFVYFVPTVFADVLPVACLTGSIVAITLLARSSELVAMLSSGIGVRRVTAPVLLATAALCGLLFVVQNNVAPGANRRAQAIEDRISGRNPMTYSASQQGLWAFGPDGRRLLRYGIYDPYRRQFSDLHVFTLERGERPHVLDHRFAKRARWTGETWEVEGGWYRTFDPPSFVEYEGIYNVGLDVPADVVEQRQALELKLDRSDQLGLDELVDEIDRAERSGYDTTRLRVAFHSRYARAVTPLVMVLLGLPFAFKIGRRGSLYGIGVALLLVLVYWATFAVFEALGIETLLHPVVAAWTPNALFGLLGSSLLLYVRT